MEIKDQILQYLTDYPDNYDAAEIITQYIKGLLKKELNTSTTYSGQTFVDFDFEEV